MSTQLIVGIIISVVAIYLIASQGSSNSRRRDKELFMGQRSFDRYRIRPRLGTCLFLVFSAAAVYYLIYVIMTR